MPDRKTETFTHTLTTAGTGQSSWFHVERYSEAQLVIDITATAGTSPTFDLDVETSPNTGAATVITADVGVTVTQITATGTARYAVTNYGKWIRFNFTVGGSDTPTFTGSISFIAKN